MDENYDGFMAYRQSKLANVLFTYELAERLKGTRVTVNCLNPGGVNTKIGQANSSGWTHWAWRLARPFFLSIKKGAETPVYLASSPDVENVSGKYFEKCKAVKSAALSYDTVLAKKLWQASERLSGIRASE
jgi:NAD(P)-dependent dehydrogenase (short-subunit alcohol dehydrogenase family)